MTEAQKEWLARHPEHEPFGPPRPGVRFKLCGTLYADGEFDITLPMKPVILRPGCIGVGVRIQADNSKD